jgi:hypothetical protein
MLYKKVLGMKENKNSSEFKSEFKSIDKNNHDGCNNKPGN